MSRGDIRIVTLVVKEGEWGNYLLARVNPDGSVGEPIDEMLSEDLRKVLGVES